ncbi:MAG: acyl-CoA dehydrogenase family protein, partial [Gammaproteobacteria bacterium]|nr:acyl-CoA dehydrogenase family protein [Gammaproteobacteria bacterium]
MSLFLSEDQLAIRDAIGKLCADFDPDYWLDADNDGRFPQEFVDAVAAGGWLGITEAALMMQAVTESGAGFSGASAIHLNVFGLNPVVVFGSDEQKRRMLPPMLSGEKAACFGVTEPNAGLDTLSLTTRAERSGDGYVVNGQ